MHPLPSKRVNILLLFNCQVVWNCFIYLLFFWGKDKTRTSISYSNWQQWKYIEKCSNEDTEIKFQARNTRGFRKNYTARVNKKIYSGKVQTLEKG